MASNIVSRLGIAAMVALGGVLVRDQVRCDVWDCFERSKHEHLLHNLFGKLFDLSSNVTKESVA